MYEKNSILSLTEKVRNKDVLSKITPHMFFNETILKIKQKYFCHFVRVQDSLEKFNSGGKKKCKKG